MINSGDGVSDVEAAAIAAAVETTLPVATVMIVTISSSFFLVHTEK